MEIQLSNRKVWSGTYKGVHFEINNWKEEPNDFKNYESDCWNYYIFINLNRVPDNYDHSQLWLKPEKKSLYQ